MAIRIVLGLALLVGATLPFMLLNAVLCGGTP